MKTKIIAIALMSVLLVGCGKSEEEKKKEEAQAQLVAMQIENNQGTAVAEALNALASLKGPAAEYYANNGNCSKDILIIEKANEKRMNTVDNISISNIPNGCQLKATFKESTFIPDLSKESMILTMNVDKGEFLWKCEFTGKNKRDIPKSCK